MQKATEQIRRPCARSTRNEFGDPILPISEHKVKQNYIAFAMRIKYDPQEYVGCAERDCFGRFALKTPN